MDDSRVALVLGGSRGLGFLIAEDLLRRGHRVVIAARNADALESARARLGPGTVTHTCDVSEPEDVASLVEWVEAEVGPIDAAFFVAGIIQVGPWQATRLEHVRACIDIMLYGPTHLALALTPRMVERGRGHLCIVTSLGGRVSVPRLVPYSMAKFGALGLAEGLSAELAGTGVSVTAAIPGIMRTGSHGAATFFGDAAKQYAWFAPVASSPLTSVDGARAARKIVTATLAGRTFVHVGLPARLAGLAHGVLPTPTVRALGLVSRLLPRGTDPTVVTGDEVRRRERHPLVDRLTRRADAAAPRANQSDGRG